MALLLKELKTEYPFLYRTPGGGYRLFAKIEGFNINKYFKNDQKQKAIQEAKQFNKKVEFETKGWLTRQDIAKAVGVKDTTIEKAKQDKTRGWKAIEKNFDIKKFRAREWYKPKEGIGKKAALDAVNKVTGTAMLNLPRGENTVTAKIRKILDESDVPLDRKDIQEKLTGKRPKTFEDFTSGIKNAVPKLKRDPKYKNKIKDVSKDEVFSGMIKSRLEKRAPIVLAIRNQLVSDPDSTTEEIAEAMYGSKKYKNSNMFQKLEMQGDAARGVVKFFNTVSSSKSKTPLIPGFKDISPDKLGEIIESIESRITDFGFEPGTKRALQFAIADSLRNLPERTTEKMRQRIYYTTRNLGKEIDETVGLSATFKNAPGYSEATQLIDKVANRDKGRRNDPVFSRVFKKALDGDFSEIDSYNQKAELFAKKYNIDTPLIRTGENIDPKKFVSYFDEYSPESQKNILDIAKTKGVAVETKSKPLSMLFKAVENSSKKSEACAIILSKATGGIATSCAEAIKKDPVGSAKKLQNLDVQSGPLFKVKNAATSFLQSPRLRGAGKFGAIAAGGAVAAGFVKQFMNDDPTTYLSNEEQQKNLLMDMVTGSLDDTPEESPAIGDAYLPALGAATVAGTAAVAPSTIDAVRGGALGAKKSGITKTALKVLGKGLATTATPLGLLATEPLYLADQVQQGDSLGEMATNPFNYLGAAFAGQASDFAAKGGLNPTIAKTMRLGISPSTVKMVSRRFGLPGLALSAGISGYEMYQNKKAGRGLFDDG